MAKMGDWRGNKDQEIPLDGIGGVNILVKADVHRSGMAPRILCLRVDLLCNPLTATVLHRHQLPLLRLREPS